jgi:hypothetical protein
MVAAVVLRKLTLTAVPAEIPMMRTAGMLTVKVPAAAATTDAEAMVVDPAMILMVAVPAAVTV